MTGFCHDAGRAGGPLGAARIVVWGCASIGALVPARLAGQITRVHESALADSIRFDQPPIAGPAARVFRFLFSGVPQSVQIAGVVVGLLLAIAAAVLGWRHRAAIRAWFASRSRAYKLGLGAAAVTAVAVVGGVGAWSYNYMMHVNDFCASCHVMTSAVGRFQKSEHDTLGCHTCHRQSIFASSRELYYWVLDRPEKIPPHAPVPNAICAECHIKQQPDSVWQRVSATAGHRLHMESDSTALRDVMCVSCHAREVHAFSASDQSCAQSSCHDKLEVRLGRMSGIRELHCVTCHEFARPIDERLPIDSTRRSLVPARPQCFSCHDMEKLLAERGLDKDPHKAQCGTCHNPHEQTKAATALDSCGAAGCHANADTLTAFHRGLGDHALSQCGSCHAPHSWKVESTDCLACHRAILRDDARLPTRRAENRQRRLPSGPNAGEEAADPWDAMPRAQAPRRRGAPPDSFSHARHRAVACTACHSARRTHGEVTVRAKGECQACHHAADARAGPCEACHTSSALGVVASSVRIPVRVAGRAAVERALSFTHAQHTTQPCASCHADDVAKSVKVACGSCHADHHGPRTACVACHTDSRRGHDREAHLGCASCHTEETAAALPPRRQVCLACHREQETHYPGRECAPCHRTSWPTKQP